MRHEDALQTECSSMCEEAFMKLDAEPGSIKISNLGPWPHGRTWLKNFWCLRAACTGAQTFASFFHGSFCCLFFPTSAKTIGSRCSQKKKIKKLDIFISDDGSTDKTLPIIKNLIASSDKKNIFILLMERLI